MFDAWPQMIDGPVSALARAAWLAAFVPIFAVWVLELTLLAVLTPVALLIRSFGRAPWWIEVRWYWCVIGLVRAENLTVVRRVHARVREKLLADDSISYVVKGPGAAERTVRDIVAAEGAELTWIPIDPVKFEQMTRIHHGYARRRWFLWRRRLRLTQAQDWMPEGLGDTIAFLVLGTLYTGAAAVELLAETILLPFVVLARLMRVLPWPIEEVHVGEARPYDKVHGVAASARARRELATDMAVQHSPRRSTATTAQRPAEQAEQAEQAAPR